MGFEMDQCKDALRQYDGDVNRALNHVLSGKTTEQQGGVNGVAPPPVQEECVREEQLATALQSRLRVVGGSGESTPTNCRTPVKSNTPRTGESLVANKFQNSVNC